MKKLTERFVGSYKFLKNIRKCGGAEVININKNIL